MSSEESKKDAFVMAWFIITGFMAILGLYTLQFGATYGIIGIIQFLFGVMGFFGFVAFIIPILFLVFMELRKIKFINIRS